MTKDKLQKYFEHFSNADPGCNGLERLFSNNGRQEIFKRLKNTTALNINVIELNVLFSYSNLQNISPDFFKFYWLTLPEKHSYNLKELELGHAEMRKVKEKVIEDGKGVEKEIEKEFLVTEGGYEKDNIENYFFETDGTPKTNQVVNSIQHLRWGFLRIFTDALLYFGDITNGFNELSKKNEQELADFFKSHSFDLIPESRKPLEFKDIEKNDRFLISEAVCKNLDANEATQTNLRIKLIERYKEAVSFGKTNVQVAVLLDKDAKLKEYKEVKDAKAAKENKEIKMSMEDDVSTSEFLETYITKEEDIDGIVVPLYNRFMEARGSALENTKIFLSYLGDVDVYVATSMRGKDDFLKMTDTCHEIFHESTPPNVKELNLLYFDPTISAAEGHDDKGLIECLMVECAKVLIYTSGDKDSYGKDAEAAMALSSGKPVIFYCPDVTRNQIAKNIHPLTKLINFKTGVVNGAMVAEKLVEVKELLKRLFSNQMRYMLTNEKVIVDGEIKIEKAYFKLKDSQTTSSVRVQTSDLFLSKSFWNYFKQQRAN